MQTQTSSMSRVSRRRPARAADPTSIFDELIAERRAVADVFDLLQDELAQPEPDRNVCVDLLMKIDALLAPPTRAQEPHTVLAPANHDRAAQDPLCDRLQALAEADRAWRAKAEVLIELVELRVFDADPEVYQAASEH